MQNTFPKDITDSMRNCILSIFWKKTDIIDFFKNNSCTKEDLSEVTKTGDISRSKIIDNVFNKLHSRNDGGIGQFRSILKSLINWNTFDPYYFQQLAKLDEEKARQNINHLKQLQEIRDAKIKKEISDREERNKNLATKYDSKQLRLIFNNLYQGKDENGKTINSQKRGYLLEDLLKELFIKEKLIKDSFFKFSIEGEQVDGTLKFEGENYIIEAKWQDKQVASNALYVFAHKIEGKMQGRGIFISVNDYSDESVRALKSGKALNTILIDGADLTFVIEEMITFKELLDKKIRAAQTQGKIYFDVFSEKSKIKE